jgi:FkbM family methyltransferase
MIQINQNTLLPFIKNYFSYNPVIVEAGAFNGKDTVRLATTWPHATIHAFEPVIEIYQELCLQTSSFNNIYSYQLALSASNGFARFYLSSHPKYPGKICQAGTLLKPKERLLHSPIVYNQTILVPTITLDTWAIDHSISSIDFLWLDLQGHELAVLQASPKIVATIKLLYIEVNFIEAYEGQPSFQILDSWLKNEGFKPIARDYTDKNKWFFGNILYLRK